MRLNLPIQTVNDAIIYLKIQLYMNQIIRLSPVHSLGGNISTIESSDEICDTSTKNKVLIAACLFLSQKINDTEQAKIRDVINAVWIASSNSNSGEI